MHFDTSYAEKTLSRWRVGGALETRQGNGAFAGEGRPRRYQDQDGAEESPYVLFCARELRTEDTYEVTQWSKISMII